MDDKVTLWEAEDGTVRVRAMFDPDPMPPYDDGSSPIVAFPYDGRPEPGQVEGITSYRLPADARWAATYYADRHGAYDGSELWLRHMRLWHGATSSAVYGTRYDLYVTCDPADWREKVGAPEGSASVYEWAAYCDGDVAMLTLERLTTWTAGDGRTRDEWEVEDAVGGFYGMTAPELRAAAADYFGAYAEMVAV
jgi:hypothetical protein